MHDKLDIESARMLLVRYDGWFGPPAIYLENELLDGRLRTQAFNALKFRETQRCIVRARIPGDAVLLLCTAGHYDRAKALLPAGIETIQDGAAYCCCSTEDIAPMFAKRPRKCPPMKPRTTPRRRQAIEQMAILYREAREGTGFVSAEQIKKVLDPWISKKQNG